MKTIATILIFLISMTGLFAFNDHNPEELTPYASLSSYANGTSADLIFPWADGS